MIRPVRGRCNDSLTVVVQEFFNEIDMCEYHPPTAITLQLQFIKSVSGILSGWSQLKSSQRLTPRSYHWPTIRDMRSICPR